MQSLDMADRRSQLLFVLLLLLIAGAGAVDLVLDAPTSSWSFHVLFELGFVLLCLGSAGVLAAAAHGAQRAHQQTRRLLERRQGELEEWRKRSERLLEGLGIEIDRQLRSWRLSPAEREIALLLLKGYSTREIADLLGKSDRTVRQHCSAGYKKSGLSGRAKLSAFFIEDLLQPLAARGEVEAGHEDPEPNE